MPTNTYIALATLTLTGSDTEVVFGSIPGSYRDLVLVANAKTASGSGSTWIRLNGDTGSNYSYMYMFGNGSSTGAGSGTDTRAFVGGMSTSLGNYIFHVMDYSATDKHKPILNRSDETGATYGWADRWTSTAAVTSITLGVDGVSLGSGSTFSLYGIAS